jgi:hypothetical protein
MRCSVAKNPAGGNPGSCLADLDVDRLDGDEHRPAVGDYETFKKVFLDDQERRRRSGPRGARVHRNADDPNNVYVVLEFETAQQARTHAEGLEPHETIKWATGNVSMPSFVVLEPAMETDA